MNFLYPELSPNDRFKKILELHLMPVLQEEGFKLLTSGPSLKLVENGFELLVEFDGRKWNGGNYTCRFNPYFRVRNSTYRKYLKKNPDMVGNFGDTGQIGTTSGIRHWDKQLFSVDGSEAYFLEDNDFAKYDNLQLVEDMIKNIRSVGIPYFQMMSNFESIRNFYHKTQQLVYAPMMIDICYVLDKEDQLESVFDWYYGRNENAAEWLNQQVELRHNKWKEE